MQLKALLDSLDPYIPGYPDAAGLGNDTDDDGGQPSPAPVVAEERRTRTAAVAAVAKKGNKVVEGQSNKRKRTSAGSIAGGKMARADPDTEPVAPKTVPARDYDFDRPAFPQDGVANPNLIFPAVINYWEHCVKEAGDYYRPLRVKEPTPNDMILLKHALGDECPGFRPLLEGYADALFQRASEAYEADMIKYNKEKQAWDARQEAKKMAEAAAAAKVKTRPAAGLIRTRNKSDAGGPSVPTTTQGGGLSMVDNNNVAAALK